MYIHIFRSYVNSSVKYLLTLFILLKIGVSVYSQGVDKYVVTRSTSIVYSSIASTGSSIGSWRNSGTFSQDDNRSYTNDIGFDFWYNGTRYSQFSVSTNGFIDFSSSTSDGTGTGAYGYTNAAFYGDGSGTWLSIAPFYDDMTAEGGTGALGNSIKYLVSGSAPNRVLTVEWINMAVYLNTAPDLDFQLKLYETTGVIEFVYDTMSTGGASFNYTCGINAVTLNNAPTIAQLKCQQTANSTTFNNGQVGNLATLPTSQSKITFTPPTTTPGSPSGSVTFTGITSTGMTLNWTDWCSNELGYAIYNSTDGTNYTFVSQTAASATTYAAKFTVAVLELISNALFPDIVTAPEYGVILTVPEVDNLNVPIVNVKKLVGAEKFVEVNSNVLFTELPMFTVIKLKLFVVPAPLTV